LALSETNKEKSPINVSELRRKIALILHCETPPCDVEKVRRLYEDILSVESTRPLRLGYGVILQHTARNKEELALGHKMEKQETDDYMFECSPSYELMSDSAKLLASRYQTPLYFPVDMAKSKHWSSVAQSYKEYAMYRCKDRTGLGKCSRSPEREKLTRKETIAKIMKFYEERLNNKKLNTENR